MAILLIATVAPLAAAAVRESVMHQEARRVTGHAEQLLASSFTPEELRYGLSEKTRGTLDRLSARSKTVGIRQVRLWNRDGTLLYSTDESAIGQRAPLSEGLRAAVRATPAAASAVDTASRPFSPGTMYLSVEGYLRYLAFREHQVWLTSAVQTVSPEVVIAEAADGGVARLYLPVQLLGSAAPSGAFEISYDFRPLERRVADLQRGVWAVIPGGILALYCSMLVVMQQTPAASGRRREDLRAANVGVFRALATVVDARDSGTGDHSERVASYAVAIGRQLDLSREALAELSMAAELHDIGKISVPDAVLRKPGPLTEDEWELMRQHAVVGSRILHSAPLSDGVKQAVRHAHEWWNGRGYPDHLKGEQIPLYARMLAVADAYEAMTSTRPYRPALSRGKAVSELQRMRGAQFDPRLVDLFCAWLTGGSQNP